MANVASVAKNDRPRGARAALRPPAHRITGKAGDRLTIDGGGTGAEEGRRRSRLAVPSGIAANGGPAGKPGPPCPLVAEGRHDRQRVCDTVTTAERQEPSIAFAVETRGLVKRFAGGVVGVDGLDLAVEPGQTYGLLGPNGAGKSTTLRILLGLMAPSAGTAEVLGRHPGDPETLRRVGSMGETAFYSFLSGRDNVRVAARRCRLPDARADEVLEAAGLAARARDRVAGYSLGMKQRLGIALAMLKDPELLILDEPSSGLDPIGQIEMQALIRRLAGEGRTILLSSHDMDEVEALCGRVAVIGGGRLLFEGTPGALRGSERRPLREVFLELTGRRTGGSDSRRERE